MDKADSRPRGRSPHKNSKAARAREVANGALVK
jgi:hypothetical protein